LQIELLYKIVANARCLPRREKEKRGVMSDKLGAITVAARFHGPPRSANGGYICGRIGHYFAGPAEITLRKPPPLDTEMSVERGSEGRVDLLLEGDVIATAKASQVPTTEIDVPTLQQATAAGARTIPGSAHPLPHCFVCGPHRDVGDGLRIGVGPVDPEDSNWQGLLATVWHPDASLADENEVVRPEFLWAALDCPTAFATGNKPGMPSVLLGRQTVRIDAAVKSGEAVIVAAKGVAQERRKHTAHSWLFNVEGELLGECRAVWIEVSAAVLHGLPG